MADDDKAQIEAMRLMVGGALQQMGREIEGMSKKAKDSSADGGGLFNFNSLITGMTKNLSGPLGLAAAITATAKSLDTFAVSRLQLRNLSTDIGLSVPLINAMGSAMEKAGVNANEAQGAISNLGQLMQDFSARGQGSLLAGVLRDTGESANEIDRLLRTYRQNADKGTLEIIRKLEAEKDSRVRSYRAKELNLAQSHVRAMQETQEEMGKVYEADSYAADQWHKKFTARSTEIANTWAWLNDKITQGFVYGSEAREKIIEEYFPKGGGKKGGGGDSTMPDWLQRILHPMENKQWPFPGSPSLSNILIPPAGANAQPGFDERFGKWPEGQGGQPRVTDFGGRRRTDELIEVERDSNKTLKDILDIFQRDSAVGDGGGTGTGTLGTGIRRAGGGEAQASLGGFRPFGNKNPSTDDPRGLSSYIKETAKKYGIDPDTALRVAQSEGLRDFTGDKGTSFGAYQAHIGGGLGDEYKQQTGKDPSDPKNERDLIDWQLRKAGKEGWGPYHGASRVGVSRQMGIGGTPGYGAAGTTGDKSAFIMHHTGGRGTVEGVMSTLRQRGLGVQYIMDREGNVVPAGGSSHMKTGWGPIGEGLSNRNTIGMEVIAKNDRDVLPVQIEAAKRFVAEKFPNLPVYGHGQVNPGHKEATEGMSIVNAVNAERQAREQIDRSQVGQRGGGDANMNATINFENMPSWVKSSVDSNNKFKELKVTRSTPQAGKASSPQGDLQNWSYE